MGAALLAIIAVAAVAGPSTAEARARSTSLEVTIAARVCPTYESISANRARNDIQESLRDLGENTRYQAGEAIDPKIEADAQAACSPLPAWDFTLGTGIKTRAVSGPWGSLSIVTDPYSTAIRTEDSVPLLDPDGAPTGKQIRGATTIELTGAQAVRAASPSRLWIQGGTPTDPILDQIYPSQYGFGALRCGIDNLNGDNVEWISYPTGARHVFCYAYYVQPPPTSGTIVIRKQTSRTEAPQTFEFSGNLSFNPGGQFNLTASDSKPSQRSFIRAETTPDAEPWRVREDVPKGWKLDAIECASQSGESTTQTNLGEARATIDLAAGDLVTCTYTDRRIPKPGTLTIQKVTNGGVGEFKFEVEGGEGPPREARATTTEEGVEVAADPSPISLDPGEYRITEKLPDSTRGRWELAEVTCNDEQRNPNEPVRIEVTEASADLCTFRNRFTPKGSITIDKVTLGAVGTAGFVVSPTDEPDVELLKSATTEKKGKPARATGDPTDPLALGTYVIQETSPTEPIGTWSLSAVSCNGKPQPFDRGQIRVEFDPREPRRQLRVHELVQAQDRASGTPRRGLGRSAAEEERPPPELVAGDVARYRVEVTNLGPDRAEGVFVQEAAGAGGREAAQRAARARAAAARGRRRSASSARSTRARRRRSPSGRE